MPVFGVGEHEGVHYYAMQFIQGQGLDAVLARGEAAAPREARAVRRSSAAGRPRSRRASPTGCSTGRLRGARPSADPAPVATTEADGVAGPADAGRGPSGRARAA